MEGSEVSPPTGTARWHSAAFLDELRAFVAGAAGEPTRLEQERLRPWSTVWRAETPTGTFYAKENCPGQRHEAALLQRLVELVPERVVPLTAVDLSVGLLLTPDQGPTVRDRGEEDVATWCRIVSAAAQLQREIVGDAESLDLADLTPHAAAATAVELFEELTALPAADPRRLDGEDARRVEAVLPRLPTWADQVAAVGLPATMNHNDLHGANVFADGLRFFDFGDAVLAEPLGALRIPLNVVGDQLGCEDDAPRLLRVRDAALEVWSDLAPVAEMRAAVPAALHLARVARAVSWHRCLPSMTAEELAEFGDAPAQWLVTLAENPPAG